MPLTWAAKWLMWWPENVSHAEGDKLKEIEKEFGKDKKKCNQSKLFCESAFKKYRQFVDDWAQWKWEMRFDVYEHKCWIWANPGYMYFRALLYTIGGLYFRGNRHMKHYLEDSWRQIFTTILLSHIHTIYWLNCLIYKFPEKNPPFFSSK